MNQQPLFPDLLAADPLATHRRVPCRACQAPMIWLPTTHGRTMPLDPAPVPNGNVVLVRDGNGLLVAEYLRRNDVPAAGTLRYQSHFASCEFADDFRRKP